MFVFLEGVPVAERVPPENVLLFAYGKTRYIRDGAEVSYEFCEADADRIISEFRAGGVDLTVDYNHQSLLAAQKGFQAPAAGWITALEKTSSGLSAKVKWTDRARNFLEAGEYRYTSPTFFKDKKTGHVAKLVNLALTNIPATIGCPELVAAENIPDDTGRKEHPMKDVLELLGLEGDLDGNAAEAAIRSKCKDLLAVNEATGKFMSELKAPLALEGDLTLENLQGAVLGLVERAKQGDAAKTELAQMKSEAASARREVLIAEALSKGMPNAQKEWAGTLTLEQLEGYCQALKAGSPNAVPVGKTASAPAERKEKKKPSAIFEKLELGDDDDDETKKKEC